MAYGFSRYKYNSRRGRKLTKAYIYSNRSAKSQSRQIARINRKVNYLARANRPEVLTMWRTFHRTFTNSALASNYDCDFNIDPWISTYGGRSYAEDLQGHYCRAKGFNLNMMIEYSDSWSGNVAQSENHQRSASYRIVIIQDKNSYQLAESGDAIFSKVFQVTSSLVSQDENITLPLKTGIKGAYKILYVKSFTISNQHPIKNIRLYIPGTKLMNFSQEALADGSFITASPKGRIHVCILTGGLHSDADYNSQISMAWTGKIAFTDN